MPHRDLWKLRRDLWLACAGGVPSRLPLAAMSQPPGPPHPLNFTQSLPELSSSLTPTEPW